MNPTLPKNNRGLEPFEKKHSAAKHDLALLRELKIWRRELAKLQEVDPSVILQDKVLKQLCSAYPVELSDLVRIKGMGSRKIEDYGASICYLVRQYCVKNERGFSHQAMHYLSPSDGRR
jgi:superfamily II DNA helicase RecQ